MWKVVLNDVEECDLDFWNMLWAVEGVDLVVDPIDDVIVWLVDDFVRELGCGVPDGEVRETVEFAGLAGLEKEDCDERVAG